MSELLIAVFLPLFPLSMLFNGLLARITRLPLRLLALLVWPQIGLALMHTLPVDPPPWLLVWAVLTSGLYGLRLLALRDFDRWISFLATSSWSLLWVFAPGDNLAQLHFHALGFSLPLLLLAVLANTLVRHHGGAYIGLGSGLAQTLPRFSAVLVVTLLAAIATPPAPAFFTMLSAFLAAAPTLMPGLVLVWLLWTWAGARLIQGIVVGTGKPESAAGSAPDLGRTTAWLFGGLVVAFIVGGALVTGDLP